jgi:copper chaperone
MITKMKIQVENLKCGGCVRSILKGLAELPGIRNAEVDLEQGVVEFEGVPASRSQVAEKLRSMGYPERGELKGVGAGLASAKSFLSCAVGRLS